MNFAKRGVDAFRSDYVSLEWITNEFKEDMQSGAKREIPRIANLPKFGRRLRCGQAPGERRAGRRETLPNSLAGRDRHSCSVGQSPPQLLSRRRRKLRSVVLRCERKADDRKGT